MKHFKYNKLIIGLNHFFLILQTAAVEDASSAVSLEPENCKAHTRKG